MEAADLNFSKSLPICNESAEGSDQLFNSASFNDSSFKRVRSLPVQMVNYRKSLQAYACRILT